MPFTLEMVPGGGILQLRDAEPYSLAPPTRITGTADEDTGALSGLGFSTPTVEIEQQITSPLRATVFIEAVFSTVAPGSGTIDTDGNVSISQAMTVDLHIEVVPEGGTQPMTIPGDCTASPVELTLTSTAPYDPETGQVTMAAGDFTIPEIPAVTGTCDSLIAPEVNAQLRGAGHSLSLLLQGDLPVPPDGTCSTTTALAVAPAGSSRLGAALTFTSTTAPDPADADCAEEIAGGAVLGGVVDFLRDGIVIGSGEIAGDGTATFTTSGLPAGDRTLTARFRGNNPFIRSTSAPVTHLVTVAPQITTNLPERLPLGQTTEFTLTVTNTGLGESLDDVRVDISMRVVGLAPTLERFDGTTWTSVPVVDAAPNRRASLPAFDLAPGAERTERLRVTPPASPAPPRMVTVTFEVVPDDAPSLTAPNPAALGSAAMTTAFIVTERIASQFSYALGPDFAFEPHTVRQGGMLSSFGFTIAPTFSGYFATGHVEFLIDGRVVPVKFEKPRPGEEATRVPVNVGIPPTFIPLSPTIPTGTRQLTIRYSGDAVYLPHQETHSFTVLPARGPSYACAGEAEPPVFFQANVVAHANLPASATAGTAIDLGNLDISLLTDRALYTWNTYFTGYMNDDAPTTAMPLPPGTLGLEGLGFSVNGSEGTATGVTRSNSWPFFFLGTPQPAPEAEADHVMAFDGESGSFVLDGAAGEVVPVALESIAIDLRYALGSINVVCTPVGDPVVLGEVRVAGVELAVSPGGSVRAGRDVTLTADTGNPDGAGVAEFLDGATTIGVVPLVGGTASVTTDALAVGARSLSVRVFPNPAAPMLVGDPVTLTVLPEHDCAAYAEAGSGAVVRLVYMELLGRCPDPAGFAYWKGRLDSGTSSEVFARAIARTPEAVGRVVDDAYEAMLGRAPDAEGRAFWVKSLSASGRYDALLADLGASGEFWSQAGSTDSGFVTRVYERLLGRAPDAGGLDHWVGRLQGGASRRALIVTLARLDEPLGRLVVGSFDEILGRAPNTAERRDGIAFLRATGDRSALYAQLIGRPEFATRAGTFPNPED